MPSLNSDRSLSNEVEARDGTETDVGSNADQSVGGMDEMSTAPITATSPPTPQDYQSHHNMIKFIFILLGVGLFLPWNAFISAAEYFETRLCVRVDETQNLNHFHLPYGDDFSIATSSDEQSDTGGGGDKGDNFMQWFGLIYNLSGVVTLGVMLMIQRHNDRGTNSEDVTEIQQNRGDGIGENGRVETLLPSHSENMSHLQRQDQIVCHDFDRVRKRLSRMIIIPFFFSLLVMIITALLVLVPTIDPFLFQVISLASAAASGISGAIVSAGIVSFASIFPPMLGIQPHITGQRIGAVIISILDIVLSSMEENGVDTFWESHCDSTSLTTVENNFFNMDWTNMQSNTSPSSTSCPQYKVDWGAFCYFLIGSTCIIFCIVLYIYLERHPVTAYYWTLQGKGMLNANPTQHHTIDQGLLQDSSQNNHIEGDFLEDTMTREGELREPLLGDSEHYQDPDSFDNIEERLPSSPQFASTAAMSTVWKIIRNPSVSVFVTFFITLTIFPSWVTKLESVQQCMDKTNRLRNDLYVPIFIVMFNVFELQGIIASGWVGESAYRKGTLEKKLSLATIARFIFLPIFLLCKASGSILVPPWKIFYSDWFQVIFMILFGFTNGLISAMSFIQGTILTPKSDEAQNIASTILNIALNGGCLAGSLFSFVYNYMGTGQW